MSQEDVLERLVVSIFHDLLKKYLDERERVREIWKAKGKEVVFVHELCECAYKRKLRLIFPEIEKASFFNPRFLVGHFIELAVKILLNDQKDHLVSKELFVNGKQLLVCGHIDAIFNELPVEIKYQTDLQGIPHEHHILQLKLYSWLSNSSFGLLVYISPEGVKIFKIENDLNDEKVIELFRKESSPMWVEWECNYCVFERFCEKSSVSSKGYRIN
ncbi:MAG: hypothetical protein QXS21_03155 [Thermoproteota archaeon]|nr:hypothetical protein [Candidatus Brockarchaeota archaeon]MBO3801711.1 hypothetical protein [Candidatus Brockarchaeota archaeon]